MDYITLAQYGSAGIALALVGALVIIVKSILTMVGNHLSHNTESNERLSEKIEQMLDFLGRR